MKQHWATLSIDDYSQQYFNAGLVLFDGVVIPVPTEPFPGFDGERYDNARRKADQLDEQSCIVLYDWSPTEYDEFIDLNKGMAHALAAKAAGAAIAGDRLLSTRYHIQDLVQGHHIEIPNIPVDDVVVMPLFGSDEQLHAVDDSEYLNDGREDKEDSFEIVLKQLAVPSSAMDLKAVLKLRERPEIREQLGQLREWQTGVMQRLHEHRDDPIGRATELDLAELELANAAHKYNNAYAEFGSAVWSARLTAVFAALRGSFGGVVDEGRKTFAVRHKAARAWRALSGEDFAYAAVVCAVESK